VSDSALKNIEAAAEQINHVISERIHDADSQKNENMVHCLHAHIQGKMTLVELYKRFEEGYGVDDRWVNPPWKK